MSTNEVVARIVGELRDERERLANELADIDGALAKLEGTAQEPTTATATRSQRAPKAVGSAPELVRWLAEHPDSGVGAIMAGLGWGRGKAGSALATAKRSGAVVGTGNRKNMTYSVTS